MNGDGTGKTKKSSQNRKQKKRQIKEGHPQEESYLLKNIKEKFPTSSDLKSYGDLLVSMVLLNEASRATELYCKITGFLVEASGEDVLLKATGSQFTEVFGYAYAEVNDFIHEFKYLGNH